MPQFLDLNCYKRSMEKKLFLLTFPNPVGQFLDVPNPAGQFFDVPNPAGQFLDLPNPVGKSFDFFLV